MSDEGDRGFVEAVRTLGDVLAEAGFYSDGTCSPALREGVVVADPIVFEADPTEFARRHPALRSRWIGEVSCIDVWVERRRSSGCVIARLEFEDVADLLDALGSGDLATKVRGSSCGPLEDALTQGSVAVRRRGSRYDCRHGKPGRLAT